MGQLFTNNARALLVAGISASDVALTVEAGKAYLFPSANTGAAAVSQATNWFKLTLQNTLGEVEIVYVRTRADGSAVMGNLLRGQEGTTARVFAAGSVASLRATAQDLQLPAAAGTAGSAFAQTLLDDTSAEAMRGTLGTDVYKTVPSNGATLVSGEMAVVTAGFTLNTGAPAGSTFPVYNNTGAAIVITQGAGLTLRLVGSAVTGNRSLASRGIASIWCLSTTEYIITGVY